VQVLQSEDHRCYIEFGVFRGEQTDLPDHVEQLQPVNELREKIDETFVFEGTAILEDEWVVRQF
jgi:hypothetical protein